LTGQTARSGREGILIIGPVLKMVAAFEETVKRYPLIPMGTADPYSPPTGAK